VSACFQPRSPWQKRAIAVAASTAARLDKSPDETAPSLRRLLIYGLNIDPKRGKSRRRKSCRADEVALLRFASGL